MATSLTELESILNLRPVCAISDDSSDPEPLTPNHLLLQRPVLALSTGTFVKEALCVIDQRVRPRVFQNSTGGANFAG